MEEIEVIVRDLKGKRVRIKCKSDATIAQLIKLIAKKLGIDPSKIQLKRGYTVYRDKDNLSDFEIYNGTEVEIVS